MALHDDLLTSNGGSWHTPPEQVVWSSEHRRRRDEILEGYRRFPASGFKDPRTLLALEGWREALPGLQFVGTFRHPMAVAASLQRRNGSSLEQGMELWAHYNRLLLRYRAKLAFDLISFDLPAVDYLTKMAQLVRVLGLTPPASGFEFFEPRLRKEAPEEGLSLPRHIAEVYTRLREASAET